MAVAAVTFTSCGNQAGNGGDADSTANEMEVNVLPDWTDAESAVKSLDASLEIGTPEDVEDCVEKMEVQVAKLVEEGKLDEAKAYAEKIQNFVKENKEKLTATGSALISSFVNTTEKINLDNLEASTKDWASSVKAIAGEAGAAAVTDAESAAKAVETAAQGVAGEAAKKVEGAVNKANEAKAKVDEVKNKVDAAKSKVDEVKNKVDEVKSKIDNAPKSAKEAAQQAADKAKQDARSKANDAVSKGLDKVFGK